MSSVARPTRLSGRAPHWSTIVLVAAAALLGVLLALKVLDTVSTMIAFWSWPFQFDESESMIVAETLLLDRGVNVYARLTPEQFIAAPYPPAYYLLNWPVIHAVGATFKAGRGISLLATAGVAALIYGLVWRLTRDHLGAVLGALAWGAIGIVGFWGALVKPDMLAVAVGLGGLALVLWADERRPDRVWWALPLFWLAFYSKQTAIAAAGAACVWLILRSWRRGLAFTGVYVAGAAGGSLLLDALTRGGYFYHEFTVHDLPWSAERFFNILVPWATAYAVLLVPGILGLLAWLAWDGAPLLRVAAGPGGLLRRAGRWGALDAKQGAILVAGYLVAGLLPALGAGTLGGNHNHLLDLTAGCCLGFGMGAAALRRAQVPQLRLAGAGVLLLLAAATGSLYATPHWLGHEFRLPPREVQEGLRNIAQYTSNTPGDVYSTDLSLLLATGKWQPRLWTTDPYTQTHATFFGRWDESALVAAIRARAFALIIIPPDLNLGSATADAGVLSLGIQQAIADAYHLDQRNVLFLYKPNTP